MQAAVDARGQREEVLFGLAQRRFGRGAAAVALSPRPGPPLRSRFAEDRRSRMGSSLCQSSHRKPGRPRPHRAAPRRRRRMRIRMFTDRTPGARRASSEGVPPGSRRPRPPRRRGCAGRRQPYPSRSSSSHAARGSPSRGWPTLPGFSSHSPLDMSSSVPSRRGSPVADSPSWRTNDDATCEWPIRQTRCGWESRHSSASSAESTYSHTGSRGLAW